MISRVCQRVLRGKGYEVDLAVNGLIAREMVKEKAYDLCLSDIRTPGMNGIELYRYLEQSDSDLAQKVIFSTGDIPSGNIENFLKEVKRPYLAKPFENIFLGEVTLAPVMKRLFKRLISPGDTGAGKTGLAPQGFQRPTKITGRQPFNVEERNGLFQQLTAALPGSEHL